jgi:DNA polymerase-4
LHDYVASSFYIAIKLKKVWLKQVYSSIVQTNDGQVIFQLCQQFVEHCWQHQGVWQVRLVALNPQHDIQKDLFVRQVDAQRQQLNQAIDQVNQRYGEFTVAPARLLNRSEMPNVIAPAWKPSGHRKTV